MLRKMGAGSTAKVSHLKWCLIKSCTGHLDNFWNFLKASAEKPLKQALEENQSKRWEAHQDRIFEGYSNW